MSVGTLWALCSSSVPSLSSPKPKPLQRSLRPRRTFQSFSRERAPPAPIFSLVSVPRFHSGRRRPHACLDRSQTSEVLLLQLARLNVAAGAADASRAMLLTSCRKVELLTAIFAFL